jgi:hypothetical protein
MPGIASVSSAGAVRGLVPGIVTISASVDGIMGQVTLTVMTPAPTPQIRLSDPVVGSGTVTFEDRPRPRWLWPVVGAGAVGALALAAFLLWPRANQTGPNVSGISIQVTPAQLSLGAGDSTRLTALVLRGDGDTLARGLSWGSRDGAIATVSSSGVVMGRKAGSTVILVTTRGASAQVPVTVRAAARPASVASIEVRPTQLRLGQGRSGSLQATTHDSAGAVLDGRRVEWLSSDPGVARVSRSGTVTGVASGQAIITATSEDVAAEPVPVTVEATAQPTRRAVVRMLIVPWAYVTIDGRGRGQRVRGEDTLTAGVPHTFRFERGGFATFDTTLTLQPDEQRLLRIQMTVRKP